MTRFQVDNVSKRYESVSTCPAQSAIENLVGSKVESCQAASPTVVKPYGFHALIETLHRAYDQHRNLVLRPDDIWLTISQGFAACVNQDPERYRQAFVSPEGKKEIYIRRDSFKMGEASNDWRGCFPEFSAQIREHIGAETHTLILADFSTTGDLEKAVSEVVLMDTVQSYFRYRVGTLCGIPSVTLEGTVEDWQKVAQKTRALAKFGGLDWWLNEACAIVDQFVAAAQGKVNTRFWQSIYKGESGSGGITADGHILKLIPYLTDWKGNREKNSLVTGAGRYGIGVSSVPQGVSCVPFTWDYFGSAFEYQFLAGHVGIAFDEGTNSLSPVMGWAVRPKPTSKKE